MGSAVLSMAIMSLAIGSIASSKADCPKACSKPVPKLLSIDCGGGGAGGGVTTTTGVFTLLSLSKQAVRLTADKMRISTLLERII